MKYKVHPSATLDKCKIQNNVLVYVNLEEVAEQVV